MAAEQSNLLELENILPPTNSPELGAGAPDSGEAAEKFGVPLSAPVG